MPFSPHSLAFFSLPPTRSPSFRSSFNPIFSLFFSKTLRLFVVLFPCHLDGQSRPPPRAPAGTLDQLPCTFSCPS